MTDNKSKAQPATSQDKRIEAIALLAELALAKAERDAAQRAILEMKNRYAGRWASVSEVQAAIDAALARAQELAR